VRSLPNEKLPDRTDFARYGADLQGRVDAWTRAVGQSEELAQEFAEFLAHQDVGRVEPL
jgi:hypothetical protein